MCGEYTAGAATPDATTTREGATTRDATTTREAATTQEAATPTVGEGTAGRMPAIYLSHGAPPLADDALWTRQLADWSGTLPRPASVLMVSAHWESAPLAIGATTTVPLVYDFWGFEDRYYQVTYPAPGAPGLAADVRKLLGAGMPVQDIPGRGPTTARRAAGRMYPDADVPVLQISMPTLTRSGSSGRAQARAAPGCGCPDGGQRSCAPPGHEHGRLGLHGGVRIRSLGRRCACARRSTLRFPAQGPAARQAPRTEHFAPLMSPWARLPVT